MDELIPGERASRDFRVKFPDDVIQDNLAGQLWFGAEVIIIFYVTIIIMSDVQCKFRAKKKPSPTTQSEM